MDKQPLPSAHPGRTGRHKRGAKKGEGKSTKPDDKGRSVKAADGDGAPAKSG
jgi:hypothetical protein